MPVSGMPERTAGPPEAAHPLAGIVAPDFSLAAEFLQRGSVSVWGSRDE